VLSKLRRSYRNRETYPAWKKNTLIYRRIEKAIAKRANQRQAGEKDKEKGRGPGKKVTTI